MNRDVSRTPARGNHSSKFLRFGKDGPPDRFIRMPDGRITFVELADPKMGLSPQQVRRKQYLEEHGFEVSVFYGKP